MSLRLICGRAGSGKSNFCFDEIKNKITNKEKIYMITPEQYSFTAEKKMLEKLNCGATTNAEVITFARMAYRVLAQLGGVIKPSLSKAGRAMLIYDVLDREKKNLTFLGKSNKNIELMERQLTELKKHSISLDALKNVTQTIENRYLEEKLNDIMLIYGKYEEKLKGKYIEENDRLEILSEKLKESNLFENCIFYIDEFSGFTKQEYKIIAKLLEVAKEVNVTITTDNLDLNTNIEQDLFYESKRTAEKLLYIARSNNIKCEKTVFLDKSYRFKTEELMHLEQNIQAIPYKKYENDVNNISIFLSKNSYSEVEYVAQEIIKLVKYEKYRYRDIIVVTKEIENYTSLCKAIFFSYNIPVFIDEKKELCQNEFAKYMLALIEIYSSNWSYEAVIQYLKLGFTTLTQEEIYEFENYTRKWGIKGAKWYKNEWNFGKQDEISKEKEKRMLAIRQTVIVPLTKLKEKLSGSKRVGQMNKEIYNFLVENKVIEKIEQKQEKLEKEGKIELAKEQELVYNIVMQLLEEIEELFAKDVISFEKYRELLKIGLSQEGLGIIPQTQDQVMVGDLDRTKSNSVKAIFVMGMNDGVIPKIQKQEGFLNDEDRKKLKQNGIELAKGTLENLFEDNYNVYKALSLAEEKIFFSYPSSSLDGGALRPSTYITKIKKIFPNLKEKSDIIENTFSIINENNTFEELINNLRKARDMEPIDDIWYSIEKYFEENDEWKEKLHSAKKALEYKDDVEKINKENIEKIYGNTLVTSISKLEQYRSCPFSYYLKYGLKLKPKEEYKMKPIDTGNFMHEVIDEFFTKTREREIELKYITNEQIKNIVDEIINDKLALEKYYIFTSSEKFKVLTNKLKNVIMKSMKYIIDGLRLSDFEIYANELEFKRGKKYNPITINLENGKKVEITGKIDRIDLAKAKDGNYIRIIDYKSSVKNIDLNEVVAGLQIQLLTYLDATCNIEKVMPAGVLYYSLIDPILKTSKKMDKEQIEEEMKKKFKMNGLILADVNVIKMMDRTLEKGSSNIIPAYLDKEGNISKSKSDAITKEQFENLRNYTNKIIKQIATEMLSGNIKIEPYYQKKNKKTPCDYCEYKEICNFKESKCNKYKYIPNNKKEEILKKMEEEN